MADNDFNKIALNLISNTLLMKSIRTIQQMKDNVVLLDSSLVKLSKAAGLSNAGLSQVTEEAYRLGSEVAKTGTSVLDSLTYFKNAGYSIADSMNYAKEALKTTNISDNLKDSGLAAESLIRIMKGFQKETPEFAGKINDSISEISRTGNIDFHSLITGAASLSSLAEEAGLSLEQMLGTLTGSYEILGNMEQAASGQIAIFSRLQGIQFEGGEAVSSVAQLQETFSSATNGAVNIVEKQTGKLHNLYDILNNVANIWDTLDKNTQNTLAIEAAGSAQTPVFLAMMENWDGVKNAVEAAANSFGSADKENEKYLSSLQGKLETFDASFQKLSQTAISSDFLKGLIDGGTGVIDVLDGVIEQFGILNTLATGAGTMLGAKNLGIVRKCA